jgi:hypothetical protein
MSKKLKVIIVTVPNSKRVHPLELALNNAELLDVVKFDAIMYDRKMAEYTPNFSKQRALYSKELSNGEIGCAISHQNIQNKYQHNDDSIIILEDDARIPDIRLFEKVAREFIRIHGDSNAVLSLLAWKELSNGNKKETPDHKLVRLIGRTPLTVGYVITPKAMESLSKANSDFAYLPDWPPTRTKFYITKSGVIRHGDHGTDSLIDRSGRKKLSRLKSLSKFTLISYFLHKGEFSGISEFINFAIKPTVTWRIDRIRLG